MSNYVTLDEFITLHPKLYIPKWVGFKPRVQVRIDTDSSESEDEILKLNWRVMANRANKHKRKLKRGTADIATSDEEEEYVEHVKSRVKKRTNGKITKGAFRTTSTVQRRLRMLTIARNTGSRQHLMKVKKYLTGY